MSSPIRTWTETFSGSWSRKAFSRSLRVWRPNRAGVGHRNDFGTGYSSLPNLHRLRPRGLVIDRAFLVGASNRPTQWLVARTIIELARIIEAEAIAAGIENGDQLSRLFQLGCQRAQGPYFGGGLDAGKTRALLKEGFGEEVKSLRSPMEGGVAGSPFTRFLEERS